MRKFGGLCAKEKEVSIIHFKCFICLKYLQLFVLEDDHTDPAFIFTKWTGEPPTASDKYKEKGDDT